MNNINDIGYVDGNTLKIRVTNLKELNKLIQQIETKQKELQIAIDKLSIFKLEVEFIQSTEDNI